MGLTQFPAPWRFPCLVRAPISRAPLRDTLRGGVCLGSGFGANVGT